jgi:hypothetical protein
MVSAEVSTGRPESFWPILAHRRQGTEDFMSKLLATNENTIDRALRVVLGLGLLAIAVIGPKTPLGYLGVVPLATGLLGSCPLYSLLGISTRRSRS